VSFYKPCVFSFTWKDGRVKVKVDNSAMSTKKRASSAAGQCFVLDSSASDRE
jgi:hypothetical protein